MTDPQQPFVLATLRLDLILQTPQEVLAWVASLPAADQAELSADWLARVRETPVGDPWSLSYTAIERATNKSVGGATFKGPPDSQGVVELAYGIDAPERGRGFAMEVADALAKFALSSDRVRVVRAHTKPDNEASQRVLVKCGFRRIQEVIDPEDGLVWRWELLRTE
jgi:RimJ/RimL family protein N-acetyltransferase